MLNRRDLYRNWQGQSRHRSHPVDLDTHIHWFNPRIGRQRGPRHTAM